MVWMSIQDQVFIQIMDTHPLSTALQIRIAACACVVHARFSHHAHAAWPPSPYKLKPLFELDDFLPECSLNDLPQWQSISPRHVCMPWMDLIEEIGLLSFSFSCIQPTWEVIRTTIQAWSRLIVIWKLQKSVHLSKCIDCSQELPQVEAHPE